MGRYRVVPAGGYVAQNWQDAARELIVTIQEYNKHGHKMDEYTREALVEDIKARKERHFNSIQGGLLGEVNRAISGVEVAQLMVKSARANESRSWDPGRLGAELTVYQALVSMAMKSDTSSGRPSMSPTAEQRLQALWDDAKSTGDRYKARAVAEIMSGVAQNISDMKLRRVAWDIESEASSELEKHRNTPEIQRAIEKEGEARQSLFKTVTETCDTMVDLGEGDPSHPLGTGAISMALRRVQHDGETGEIKILPENTPNLLDNFPFTTRESF